MIYQLVIKWKLLKVTFIIDSKHGGGPEGLWMSGEGIEISSIYFQNFIKSFSETK